MRITPRVVVFSGALFFLPAGVATWLFVVSSSTSPTRDGVTKPGLPAAFGASRPTQSHLDGSSVDGKASGPKGSQFSESSAIKSSSSSTSKLRRPLHPQAIAMVEELRNGDHPERFLVSSVATPFDREEYLKNPDAYLERVEPGRIWQTAQPGPGVEPLRTPHGIGFRLVRGESVKLKAQTVPGFPVTFLATGSGSFENDLAVITVASNTEGMAEVVFTSAVDHGRETTIVATSPVASGRQVFYLSTTPRRSE